MPVSEQIFGHTFSDRSLPSQALTHRSYLNETRNREGEDYQRLEFLGDAVLGLVLADLLYQRYPRLPEGDLSRLRASLVDQPRLAQLATSAGLGPLILLGRGAEQEGGRSNPSILADVFEALIGALYLDAGFSVVRPVLEQLYSPLLEQADLIVSLNDDKSELQELLAAQRQPSPVYRVVAEEGPDHDRQFVVEVFAGGQVLGQGSGRSKKVAQQAAAAAALMRMRQ